MEEDGSARTVDGHEVRYTWRRVNPSRGTLVMCHGIEMDRDEWEGLYARLADRIAEEGFSSIRFDFRGHGESGMSDLDLSVTGAVMDLEAILEETAENVHVLASSFGAVPAILCADEHDFETLTLLCPLIDTQRNYFQPARDSFMDENREEFEEKGYIKRPSGYRMSARLLYEMRSLRPQKVLEGLETPVLTVQGGEDSAVPPKVAEKYGSPNPASRYLEIEGSEHGLVDPQDNGFGEGTKENWGKFEEELLGFIK